MDTGHMKDISGGPSDQGRLNYWATEDTFHVKPRVWRPGVADLSNTKKQTQRVRQYEETVEYVPNERKRWNLREKQRKQR